MPASLSIRGLSKAFPGQNDGPPLTVLSGLDLEVPAGGFVSLVGLNGSGKTTLLRVIAGLAPADAGEVRIGGGLVSPGSHAVGMVSQELALLPWRTTRGNIELGLELKGVPAAQRSAAAQEYIQAFGLAGGEDKYPRELSGGMRQKAAIARALAPNPELLLLDEPFSALDCQIKTRLQRFLLDVWAKRRDTVLFVTHDIEEAVLLGDVVVVLSQAPARVLAVMPVDLPRWRDRTGGRFNALRREVLELLQKEADRRR
jgi:ABC-type nitrate/sulfonate/bicarbonate transport system ATPase subunit